MFDMPKANISCVASRTFPLAGNLMLKNRNVMAGELTKRFCYGHAFQNCYERGEGDGGAQISGHVRKCVMRAVKVCGKIRKVESGEAFAHVI